MRALLRTLLRPLWREDATARASRRLRQALLTPVMVLAGVVWGALAAPNGAEALGWALGGAFGFSFLAYLYFRLEPVVLLVGYEVFGRAGFLAGMLWDWLVVGGVAYLLVDVLGMPTFGAVTSAVMIGGTYAMVLASFFDDAGSRFLHGFLSGGWGRPHRAPFSHIETLLVRGEHEAARGALRDFVRMHPRDPRGWIALSRSLEDPDEAVHTLRRGMETARLTVEQKQSYLHEIVRVCDSLDALHVAVPDLERFVEEHDESAQSTWARSVLRRATSEPDLLGGDA